MIKQQLRKMARKMANWPIVGRFVRIGVAVIRLPEFRAAYLDSNHRQHIFETEQLPILRQTLSDLDHRQHVFESEQLPILRQTLSDLDHRQIAGDNDRENFVKSTPIALRKITRDLIETRGKLESVSVSMDQRLIETCGKLGNLSNSVSYILGRVEFVRRELMFEMRYGAQAPNPNKEQIKTKVAIVNPDKLAAARNEQVLRLNLGCGHIPLEGYLNIDRRALPGVDIVAEVDELPLELGEVDEIFSAHLLEHFPQEQLLRELLPYWVGLLKQGGVLRSVVPDAESMMRGYADGSYPYASLREVTFGAQDYDGDFHFNMFVTEQVEEILKGAGLVDVEWLAKGRRNGDCFEMEFRAVKK